MKGIFFVRNPIVKEKPTQMKLTLDSTAKTFNQAATVVFVDAGVDNYQQLVDGVIPTAEVFVLDAAADGIEQISQVLQRRQDVGAVHIVSHGAPGCLYLGNSQLSLDTFNRYATQLQQWDVANLLLYGCNVAAGDAGAEFIAKLQALTGAEIAASKTLTGSAALGGNWKLEVTTGQITSPLALQAETLATYTGVLGITFGTPTTFAAGTFSFKLTSGDWNNDGNLDLAVANYNSNSVTTYLGNGSGGFSVGNIINVGSGQISIVSGDWNKDGKQDLAVGTTFPGSVVILSGNGLGGFSTSTVSPGISGNEVRLVAGDWDGDGDADLAASMFSNGSGTQAAILVNNGAGTFTSAPGSPLTGLSAPGEAAVADFNKDGDLDFAVPNFGNGTVSFFLGGAGAGFSQSSPVTVGSSPWSTVAGDFDGDGDQDVAVSNQNSNSVSILTNNGTGSFTATTVSGVSFMPRGLAAADFDGDGDLDLAVGVSGGIRILDNNGSGTFSVGNTISIGGFSNTFPVVGDWNKDGKPDLAAVNGGGNQLVVLLNTTTPNQAPTDISLSNTSINENVAAGSVVGTFSTTDPDAGNSFTYSLVSGTGSTDNTAFSIIGNQLRINTSPDFETKNNYSVRVRTTDQGGLSYEEVVTVNVNNLNEAPTLTGTKATLVAGTEDTIYTISQTDLLTGFTDVDRDTLSVSNLTASNGILVNNNNGTWSFTPTANYNGAVNLNYNVTDGKGGSTSATQSFTLASVNDAPTLTGTKATLVAGTEDTTYTISQTDLLTGFTDVDRDTLSVSNLTASNGILVNNNNGTWSFTPTANYNGAVNLTYNVTDGKGGSTSATQSFTLASVNDAPTDSGILNPKNAIQFDLTSIFDTDGIVNRTAGVTDSNQQALSAWNETLVTNSFASYTSLFGNGLPDDGFFSANSFHPDVQLAYSNDDNGKNAKVFKTNGETATFSVAPNQYSEIHLFALSSGGTAQMQVQFNYADGSTETSSSRTVPDWFDDNFTPSFTQYYLIDGIDRSYDTAGSRFHNANDVAVFGFGFQPNPAKNLESITVTKGNSSASNTWLSLFGATGVDAPPLTGTPATLASGTEDTAYTINAADLLQGFTDVDGDKLSVSNLTASNGSLVNNNNGTWSFTPTANYNGTINLSYNVTDAQGGSTEATQSFTLAAVNDAPTLTGTKATLASGTEDTIYTISQTDLLTGFTDVDGDKLSVSNLTASNGILVNNNNGTWSFTPTANYNGTINLNYNVTDDKGGSLAATQSFTVAAVADAPSLSVTAAVGNENTAIPLAISSALTDTDGSENLSIQIAQVPTTAVLSAGTNLGNGIWQLTPAQLAQLTITPPLNGDGNFTLQVSAISTEASNGSTASTVETLNLTVNPVFNLIQGTPLPDNLTGTAGRDNIQGRESNDTLRGMVGNDLLDGGAGNDYLDGGTGDDTLIGGTGDDIYIVDSLGDRIIEDASGGRDKVFSSITWTLGDNLEELQLRGSADIDGTGNALNNHMVGNAGNNWMFGGDGNDDIRGWGGDDTLLGGGGNDFLVGGDGDDILIGGAGNDSLQGGTGSDTFIYNGLSDGSDSIHDFSISLDRLDLTGLFQSLDYKGSNPMADGFMRLVQMGTNTAVQIDADGSGSRSGFTTVVSLLNVSPSNLTVGSNILVAVPAEEPSISV